jgi:hypothetical protein
MMENEEESENQKSSSKRKKKGSVKKSGSVGYIMMLPAVLRPKWSWLIAFFNLYTGISTSTFFSSLDLPLFCGEVAADCLFAPQDMAAGLADWKRDKYEDFRSIRNLQVLDETSAGVSACLLSSAECC